MEAEQVTKKILADANSEAEKIKKAADEKEAAEQAEFDLDRPLGYDVRGPR